MSPFARKLLFAATAACFALSLGAAPAMAATHHGHKKAHHAYVPNKKRAKAAKAESGSEIIRVAQRHLMNLGYYGGKVDGKMGPQTASAIKSFQRDHELKADGKLGPKTRAALNDADVPQIKSSFLTSDNVARPNVNQDVNPDYVASLAGGTKVVASRFARVDVSETGNGYAKRYAVNLNGQSVLSADGQPSVVGISPTYDLGNEDAVVFTTYSPSTTNCMYRNHVLVMNNSGSKMLDLGNCTRDYEAKATNGILFVTFPEHDAGRAVGNVWRVEGMTAEKM